MPPRRWHYTVQHFLFLLELVRIRRVAGLPMELEVDFKEGEEMGEEPKEETHTSEEEAAPQVTRLKLIGKTIWRVLGAHQRLRLRIKHGYRGGVSMCRRS